jgi:hypothetical protein
MNGQTVTKELTCAMLEERISQIAFQNTSSLLNRGCPEAKGPGSFTLLISCGSTDFTKDPIRKGKYT